MTSAKHHLYVIIELRPFSAYGIIHVEPVLIGTFAHKQRAQRYAARNLKDKNYAIYKRVEK